MESTPKTSSENDNNDQMGVSRRDFLSTGMKAAIGALSVGGAGCEQKEQSVKQIKHEVILFEGGEAHKSGNEFANTVGKILQDNWRKGQPTKVVNPKVEIFVRDIGGKTEFKFKWYCDIKPCEEKDMDTHFDRRGTLLSGKTLDEAKRKVEAELRSSDKVNIMMKGFDRAYGKHKMPHSFVSESSSQTADGTWWYVREFFCTAK